MMLSTRSRALCSVPPRLSPARGERRSVQARAEGQGFDIDKSVADLPVPVEYAYAGAAWGVRSSDNMLQLCKLFV